MLMFSYGLHPSGLCSDTIKLFIIYVISRLRMVLSSSVLKQKQPRKKHYIHYQLISYRKLWTSLHPREIKMVKSATHLQQSFVQMRTMMTQKTATKGKIEGRKEGRRPWSRPPNCGGQALQGPWSLLFLPPLFWAEQLWIRGRVS